MRRYFKIVAGFSAVFFAIGMGWGAWLHKRKVHDLAQSRPLRVLCAENWLSDATLEKFSQEHSVRIQQWTYSRPSEFLRQMANADGNVDVICTSSLLLQSLVNSHWVKKADFKSLSNSHLIAVDFSHLAFDTKGEYSIPVFWNLFGFFGKSTTPPMEMKWKQIAQNKRVAMWGGELSVLQLMNRLGLNVEQKLENETESKASRMMNEDIQHFIKNAPQFLKPSSESLNASILGERFDWAEVPLASVADFLSQNADYTYWLPEDGATVELGLFAVGDKSTQPELALKLIDELISSEHAKGLHERLNTGVVHSSLSNLPTIPPLQKPEALRNFPLNRLKFPAANMEALPKFQKFFDESIAVKY